MIAYSQWLEEEFLQVRKAGGVPSPLLFHRRIRFIGDRLSVRDIEHTINSYMSGVAPLFKLLIGRLPADTQLPYSRVAQVLSGGGKRRLFVIGNYVKQGLLRPFHDWSMKILSTLECDGTYNQTKPLAGLKHIKFLWSYDLKSATDRWPRSVIYLMLANLIDVPTADSVVERCLSAGRLHVGPPLVSKYSRAEFRFKVGQGLGYHASWSLFTLSHHLVVWAAAERAYPGLRFRAYAILGDDIVIGDRKVAEGYRELLDVLEVKISENQSLISDRGCLEFAKRFIIDSGKTNVSPVSIRSLLCCRMDEGLTASLKVKYPYLYVRFLILNRNPTAIDSLTKDTDSETTARDFKFI